MLHTYQQLNEFSKFFWIQIVNIEIIKETTLVDLQISKAPLASMQHKIR